EDGLITRRHGVGTFVRKRPILNNLSFNFGTTEMIESAGLSPGRPLLGVGTVVRKRPILNNLSFNFGTTEMIESAGMTSGTRLLSLAVTVANEEVAEALALAPGDPVVM